MDDSYALKNFNKLGGVALPLDSEFVNATLANLIAEAGRLRYANGSLRRDSHLGIDNIFFPIALAGGDIARPDKARLRGHGDVVSAANAGFDHAATPDG